MAMSEIWNSRDVVMIKSTENKSIEYLIEIIIIRKESSLKLDLHVIFGLLVLDIDSIIIPQKPRKVQNERKWSAY